MCDSARQSIRKAGQYRIGKVPFGLAPPKEIPLLRSERIGCVREPFVVFKLNYQSVGPPIGGARKRLDAFVFFKRDTTL